MIRSMRMRVTELHLQRELLVEQAAIQRGELASICAEFNGIVHWMNRGASVVGWFRARPGAAGMSVLAAGLAGLGGARRWMGRALMIYQLVKFLRARLFAAKTPTLTVRNDMEAT